MLQQQLASKSSHSDREFVMTDKDFRDLADIATGHTGIQLPEKKKDLVYGRVVRRIRELKLTSFREYIAHLEGNSAQELSCFLNSITTNLTSFFREQHHFDYLETDWLEQMKKERKKRIRIWSAGCSSGEEPYSLAFTLGDHFASSYYDFKILATDLDTDVLNKAKSACYDADRVASINANPKAKWFEKTDNCYQVKEAYRKHIHFKQLNLLKAWPMHGPFDVIMCRNVVIYFDKPTQAKLFDRYADLLAPGGILFLGHSESMHGICERFTPMGKTIFRKNDT